MYFIFAIFIAELQSTTPFCTQGWLVADNCGYSPYSDAADQHADQGPPVSQP